MRFCAERCGAVRKGAVRNGAKNSDFCGAGAVRVADLAPHQGCGGADFRAAPHPISATYIVRNIPMPHYYQYRSLVDTNTRDCAFHIRWVGR